MKQYIINNKVYLYDNRVLQSVNDRIDKFLIIDELKENVIEGWPSYCQAEHFRQVLADIDEKYGRKHKYQIVNNPEYK